MTERESLGTYIARLSGEVTMPTDMDGARKVGAVTKQWRDEMRNGDLSGEAGFQVLVTRVKAALQG